MNRPQGVALFDGGYSCTFAAIRSLSRLGVPITLFGKQPWAAARYSRHVTHREACPALHSAEFPRWLEQRLRERSLPLVLPTSDLLAYWLSHFRDLLDPGLARTVLPMQIALEVLHKDRFITACQRAGLDTPRAWLPESVEAVRALAPSLPYPVIVKPRSHAGVGMVTRGGVVQNAQQLLALFKPYHRTWGGTPSLLEEHPQLRLPMIQQVLESEGGGIYSLSGYRHPSQGVLAPSVSVKLEQYPLRVGTGMVFENRHEPELLAATLPAIEALLPTGLFEIEFIRHGGRWWAIDLNPRVFGMLSLNLACGADLPALWYQHTQGDGAVKTPAPVSTVKMPWVAEVPFHLTYLLRCLRHAPVGQVWRLYQRLRAGARAGPGWGDPLAHLVYLLMYWRHPRSLLRDSFLASREPPPKSLSAPTALSAHLH